MKEIDEVREYNEFRNKVNKIDNIGGISGLTLIVGGFGGALALYLLNERQRQKDMYGHE